MRGEFVFEIVKIESLNFPYSETAIFHSLKTILSIVNTDIYFILFLNSMEIMTERIRKRIKKIYHGQWIDQLLITN